MMGLRKAVIAMAAVSAAGLTLLTGTGGAAQRGSFVKGGSGVVSTHGVGRQHFESSTPASIRAFAGRPDSIVYWNKLGQPTGRSHAVWQLWTYSFDGGGYARYSFHGGAGRWVFSRFDTDRKNFLTVRGTRVGMTYSQAKRRERVPFMGGCIDSGFWHFHGQRYAYIVGVNRGQRVHALHAYGPGQPLC